MGADRAGTAKTGGPAIADQLGITMGAHGGLVERLKLLAYPANAWIDEVQDPLADGLSSFHNGLKDSFHGFSLG